MNNDWLWRFLACFTIVLASCAPETKSPCTEEGSRLVNASVTRGDEGNAFAVDLWGESWNGQSTGAVSEILVSTRTARTYFPEGNTSLIPEEQWIELQGAEVGVSNVSVSFGKWTTPQDSNETGLPEEIVLCLHEDAHGDSVYRRR